MKALLHNWIKSLNFFSPRSLINTFLQSTWSFSSSMITLVKNFYPMIIAEFIIFALLRYFFDPKTIISDGSLRTTLVIMVLSFLISILGLILNSAIIVFIRKNEDDTTPAIPYFRFYFFRYLQFSLLVFAFVLFSLILLLGLGIKKMPGVSTALLGLRVMELLALFFWLDSSFSKKEMFLSVEKAINMFIYNLPLFISLSFIWWVAEKAILFAFLGTQSTESLTTTLISQRIDMSKDLSITAVLALKYLRFFIEYFWICIIFRAYKERSQTEYSKSIFEPNQDHE